MKRKKIGIITICVLLFLGAMIFIVIRNGQRKDKEAIVEDTEKEQYAVTYVWPKNDLTEKIPEPKSKNGAVLHADDQKTKLKIYRTSYGEYNAYVRDCRKQGFIVNDSKKSKTFKAHDVEGYKLIVTYEKDSATMLLSVDAEDVRKNDFAEGTYSTYTYKNYLMDIPNEWEVDSTTEDSQQFIVCSDEKAGKLSYFGVSYSLDDEDQVSLKALYEDNDNMIDMLEESIDHCKVTGEKEVVSDYGVKGIVYLYNHWMDTDIGRMDGKGWFYCFPSPEDNRWFIIYLMEFGDIKEDTYEDAYWKVLASIRSKE